MKKMIEVFELPIDGHELPDLIIYTTTGVEDDAIAHAINHVDALADALEFMIANNWSGSLNRKEAENKAKAALAAYRGEA